MGERVPHEVEVMAMTQMEELGLWLERSDDKGLANW